MLNSTTNHFLCGCGMHLEFACTSGQPVCLYSDIVIFTSLKRVKDGMLFP